MPFFVKNMKLAPKFEVEMQHFTINCSGLSNKLGFKQKLATVWAGTQISWNVCFALISEGEVLLWFVHAYIWLFRFCFSLVCEEVFICFPLFTSFTECVSFFLLQLEPQVSLHYFSSFSLKTQDFLHLSNQSLSPVFTLGLLMTPEPSKGALILQVPANFCLLQSSYLALGMP